MLILDTNHFSEIDRASALGHRLRLRLDDAEQPAFLTIITVEESMRGWLARLAPGKDRGVSAYSRFHHGVSLLSKWVALGWDDDTADIFDSLQATGIRIGTLDLRIASIALAYDATLLTRNLRDFRKVPGLRIENWLD